MTYDFYGKLRSQVKLNNFKVAVNTSTGFLNCSLKWEKGN